ELPGGPAARQRQAAALARVRRSGGTRGSGMPRLVVSEIQFGLGEAHRPVEHHFHGGTASQDGVGPASGQDSDQSRGRSGGGSNPGAHPGMSGGTTRNHSDG